MARCSATTTLGTHCINSALEGLDVCGEHRTQAGIAERRQQLDSAPGLNARTGRYLRILNARTGQTLEEATHDPELLSMTSEIQLLDARIADLLLRADQGESGSLWQELHKTYREMQEARREKKSDLLALKLNEIGQLIDRGHTDYIVWEEITNLLEHRRRLSESEQRRLVALKLVLTYDEAVNYATQLLAAVQNNVADPDTRNRIAVDIRRTLSSYRLSLPAE